MMRKNKQEAEGTKIFVRGWAAICDQDVKQMEGAISLASSEAQKSSKTGE
jgi:hypothetical protein